MFIMVRRLLFPLVLITVFLCSAVPALGKRALADDPAWSAFGFDACALPCWAGITPGETPFTKAYDLLIEHVPSLSSRMLVSQSQIPFSASIPSQYASGFITNSQGQVGNIRFSVQLPLIQLIERLGTPVCSFYAIDAYNASGSITIYWETRGVLIAALVPPGSQDVQPTTMIQAIALNPDDPICDINETLPWLGFAPLWRYEQAEARHG